MMQKKNVTKRHIFEGLNLHNCMLLKVAFTLLPESAAVTAVSKD